MKKQYKLLGIEEGTNGVEFALILKEEQTGNVASVNADLVADELRKGTIKIDKVVLSGYGYEGLEIMEQVCYYMDNREIITSIPGFRIVKKFGLQSWESSWIHKFNNEFRLYMKHKRVIGK